MPKVVFCPKYCQIILISGLFVFTRLVNLSALPIFNDEAIYIDWGRIMTSTGPSMMSLMDGKQPLLMWVLGLAYRLPLDPLLAGRLVSIVGGGLTLLGVYYLCRDYFDKETWYWTSLLYILSPGFLFFDRLALMESVLGAIGVWIFYLSIRFAHHQKATTLFWLCLLIASGFWIKTTGALFGLMALATLVYRSTNKTIALAHACLIILLSLTLLSPLLLQPDVGFIFTLNDRFSLKISELLAFPVSHWLMNVWSVVCTALIQISGLGLFAGIYQLYKHKHPLMRSLIIWQTLLIGIYILTVRHAQMRYLIALMPLTLLIGGYGLAQIKHRYHTLLLLLPLMFLSVVQLVVPFKYYQISSKINPQAKLHQYFSGFTAGYGIREVIEDIRVNHHQETVVVFVSNNVGNPNNAFNLWLANDSKINISFVGIPTTANASLAVPPGQVAYFVSRPDGTPKFQNVALLKNFTNPNGATSLSLYAVYETGN